MLASSCGECNVIARFTEGVSSSPEGKLAIDETTSTVRLASNVCFVPGVSRAEGAEYVQEVLDHPSGEESAARHFLLDGEAEDNDSFVDIMSDIIAVINVESEGWTFADALPLANLWRRWQRVLSIHFVCLPVSLLS